MKRRLLKFIECNKCHGPFSIRVLKKDKEIKEGSLICKKCNISYPIINYIPRFVSSKEDDFEKLKTDTIKYFGHEWVHFDRHGFDDEVYNKEYEKQIFHEKTLLGSKEVKNKLVLDAGCGNGRYTYQSLKCGAEVVGFDIGPGVESAYKNTKQFSKAHIIQADIFNLPFKNELFDYAFSIGVIHHTGDAKKAFKSIIDTVKFTGTVTITCYHKSNVLWEFNDRLIRKFTVNASINNLMTLSKFLAKTCKFCGPYVEKPVNLLFRWEPNVSIMYDWYSAPIATHHSYPEVYSWCKQFGIYVTEDLRWEKKEWLRNIKFFRTHIAPDWAITIRGLKNKNKTYTSSPKHIYEKTKILWEEK